MNQEEATEWLADMLAMEMCDVMEACGRCQRDALAAVEGVKNRKLKDALPSLLADFGDTT